MHGEGLQLALVFLLAAVLAVPLFKRFGLGAVLGYLCAGVLLGPSGFKAVQDAAPVLTASEIGVVMMLFIIGLELSPKRLWVMRRAVFGLGGLQVLVTGLLFAGVGIWLQVGWKVAVVIGFALALSSTAVSLQLLSERRAMNAEHGRTAFAILLFQDLAAIPLIAAIPLLGQAAAGDAGGPDVLTAIAAIAAVVVGGRYLLRHLFRLAARIGVPEMLTATALLAVLGSAWAMQLAHLSAGLGAFLAGVLLADSEFRHEIEAQIEPFKGLLLGLFFMAVGMSIDLQQVVDTPRPIILGTLALLGLKAIPLLLIGYGPGRLDWRENVQLAAVLALGGEFAFVVLGESLKAGLIGDQLRDQLFAIVALSMAVTPLLLFALSALLGDEARGRPKQERPADEIDEDQPQVILAGFGRMGQIIGRMLRAQNIPFTALENSAEQVESSRRFGHKIYYGDSSRPELLRAARTDKAKLVVVTTEDPDANLRAVRVIKRLFPHVKVIARARNRQHAFRLMDLGVDGVIRETFHSALDMGRQAFEFLGMPPQQAQQLSETFRDHDETLLREQHLVYDDEAALITSSAEARDELARLFEADSRSAAREPASAAQDAAASRTANRTADN